MILLKKSNNSSTHFTTINALDLMDKKINQLCFAVLCISWGFTWLAIKIGVAQAPPLFFAGTRFVAAGIIIVLISLLMKKKIKLEKKEIFPLLSSTFFLISLSFGFMFYGGKFVSASLTAIIAQGMMPIMLPIFSASFKHEKLGLHKIMAGSLSFIGLFFIFYTKIYYKGTYQEIMGIIALVCSMLAYCLGSILSRDLLAKNDSFVISFYQNLIGGIILLIGSYLWEYPQVLNYHHYFTTKIILAWAFLVIIGTVVGFSLYLYLLKTWGASKISSYALITPLIAMVSEAIYTRNMVSTNELIGIFILLSATMVSFKPKRVKTT